MEPQRPVRQVFYGCAASFTKYLVERLGMEKVVDLLPVGDPHKEMEKLTGTKMLELRSAWMVGIGMKQ